jgi:putative endonuclease
MKGWMYILACCDGSYYTGSTINIEARLAQHQAGEGANHTKKRLPVMLVYFEEYERIDDAYYREKQVQGWNRKKKEALINGNPDLLPELAIAYRDIRLKYKVASSTSATGTQPLGDVLPEALEGSDT